MVFANPWRFSFGPDGKLWLADVGQDSREEVNWVTSGGNYGWDIAEGSICHEPAIGCDMTGLIPPVWEYDHSVGQSITGGYVYTGQACPALSGQYIYADFVVGTVSALVYDENGGVSSTEILASGVPSITSFGVDRKGELYIVGLGGTIWTLNCDNLTKADVKVMLQGPYSTSTDEMTTALNAAGLLPTEQPYDAATYIHTGNEAVASQDLAPVNGIADVFDENPDITDWVVVELRTGLTPETRVASRAAWLRKDGRIVDLGGSLGVSFHDVPAGSYHIAVRQRNHLSVISTNPVALSASPALYDFTTGQGQALGPEGQKQLDTSPVVFGLYGGDADASGTVFYAGAQTDVSSILLELGIVNAGGSKSGYLRPDLDLSGTVFYAGAQTDVNVVLFALGILNAAGSKSTNLQD